MTAIGNPTTDAPLPPPGPRDHLSFASGLSGADNALNLIRLCLALLVIVSHTNAVTGSRDLPVWLDGLGGRAVGAFFVISGYLITGSRLRSAWYSFIVRRGMRIYPGFWVQLLVVGFIFAPVAAALGSGTWTLRATLRYIWEQWTLFDQFPWFTGS